MHHLPGDGIIFLNANQIIALLAYKPSVTLRVFKIKDEFSVAHKIFYDLTLVSL